MERPPELSVVIPAFNEAATVASVIDSHIRVASSFGAEYEVVVIDDGSRDATSAVVSRLAGDDARIRLSRHDENLGVALTLLELYRLSRGQWVYFAPADGQVPAEALAIMWAVRDGCSCVVGRRRHRADPLVRRIMAAMYSALVRATLRVPVTDIDSVKLFDGELLRALPIEARSTFAEAEILYRLARSGRRVREIDVPHVPRHAGRASGARLSVIVGTLFELARFFVKVVLGSRRS